MNSILNRTQHAVSALRITVIESIRREVSSKLHGSGYVRVSDLPESDPLRYLQLTVFKKDQEEQQIFYTSWGMDIMGFTEDGVINDVYVGLATSTYEDLCTEQLLFALQVALEHKELLQ